MSLNILIVEDELLIAEMLSEMLQEIAHHVVGIAKNYADAISFLSHHFEKIDLVLLDINLSEDKDGLDLGKEIKTKYGLPIIFITSYSDAQIIKKAVSLLPESYIVKPFRKSDLVSSLELARLRILQQPQVLCIKEGNDLIKLTIDRILYIQSDKNYLEVYTLDDRHVIRNSMEKFLEELSSPEIVRVHRSYSVNIEHVKQVSVNAISVGDVLIPLSRKYKVAFKEKMLS